MKINRFTLISPLLCCSILSVAQIQQNIFKVSGTMLSNLTSEIDSIRFNASGTEMQVILQGFDAELHEIIEIDRVTFDAISDQLPHSCGAPKVHNPAKSYGSMTDQQGNVYKTIVIGSQEWMAENLKTSIYSNGPALGVITTTTANTIAPMASCIIGMRWPTHAMYAPQAGMCLQMPNGAF